MTRNKLKKANIFILFVMLITSSISFAIASAESVESESYVEGITWRSEGQEVTNSVINVGETINYEIDLSSLGDGIESAKLVLPVGIDFIPSNVDKDKIEYIKSAREISITKKNLKKKENFMLKLEVRKKDTFKLNFLLIYGEQIYKTGAMSLVGKDIVISADKTSANSEKKIASNIQPLLNKDFGIAPPTSNVNINNLFHVIEGANSYVHPTYPSEVVLTDDQNDQVGGIWYKGKLDLNSPFETDMYMYLGNKNQIEGGADGITFVLQNDPLGLEARGQYGGSLGVYASGGETPWVSKSLVFEFDTYRNSTLDNEIPLLSENSGHFGVNRGTNQVWGHEQFLVGNNMTDGGWHLFHLDWNPISKIFNYSLEGVGGNSYKISSIDDVFGSNLVNWGFTGSTGGNTNFQAVSISKLPAQPSVNLIKEASVKKIDLGDSYTYTINVSNIDKKLDWLNVVLKDTLDTENLKYISNTLAVDGIQQNDSTSWNNGTLNLSLGSISAGNTKKVTFKVRTINRPDSGVIHNEAISVGEDAIGNKVASPVGVADVELLTPNVKLKKDVDKQYAKVGDELTYTITAENNGLGNWLGNIIDNLPTEYVSLIKGSTEVNGKVAVDDEVWKDNVLTINQTIKAGGISTVTFKVKLLKAAEGKEVKNIAKTDDPNVVPTPPAVTKLPKVFITKVVDKVNAKVGEELIYTITAENSGLGDWLGNIIDNLPTEYVSLIKGSTEVNGKVVVDDEVWKDNVLTINQTIKAGGVSTVTFKVKLLKAAEGKEVRNIAETDDPNVVPTPPTVTVVMNEVGKVRIRKVDADATNKTLSGATFVIAETEAQLSAGINIKVADDGKLIYPGDTNYSDTLKDYKVTTNDQGQAEFDNLRLGGANGETYYLKEVQAPTGYQLLTKYIKVTAATESSLTVTQVKNTKKFVMPQTGSISLVLTLLAGIGLVGVGGVRYIKQQQKTKK